MFTLTTQLMDAEKIEIIAFREVKNMYHSMDPYLVLELMKKSTVALTMTINIT